MYDLPADLRLRGLENDLSCITVPRKTDRNKLGGSGIPGCHPDAGPGEEHHGSKEHRAAERSK